MKRGTDQRPPSHAGSHLALEPVSGATLYELEVARRERLRQRGSLRTGCREIDRSTLLGGFERGTVVGVSAEEVDFGLLIGLQTIAHTMVFASTATSPSRPRAAIITTLAATAILPMLRDVIRSQVQAKLGPAHQDIDAETRRCLEQISISRVFDIEGLWEVISELETPPSPVPNPQEQTPPAPEPEPPEPSQRSPSPEVSAMRLPPLRTRTEVLDSEDEEDFSSSPSPSPDSPQAPPPQAQSPAQPATSTPAEPPRSHIPDIILITHVSALLTDLFTRRDKPTAHTSLQLLSSHLRYLARSADPLIMLLNSTTSPSSTSTSTSTSTSAANPPYHPDDSPPNNPLNPNHRPLSPTLRSIFNPPPPNPGAGGVGGAGYAAASALSRRNKPAFGVSFAQFLDLHVLCTRLPRGRADAEALVTTAPQPAEAEAGTGTGTGTGTGVRYCWVVEVLLDELGVWEGVVVDGGEEGGEKGKGRIPKRRSREQRWGAVDVRAGVRLVDAFEGDS
ncbi:hypothetical protein F5B20DRAFT_119735 [Whalleya microplaca]|nr:hypothetical protein F5B20DRAFT_119735 [Whalleya microplaca]